MFFIICKDGMKDVRTRVQYGIHLQNLKYNIIKLKKNFQEERENCDNKSVASLEFSTSKRTEFQLL